MIDKLQSLYDLSKIENHGELFFYWKHSNFSDSCKVITSLKEYDKEQLPTSIRNLYQNKEELVWSYFGDGKLFILNNKIIDLMQNSKNKKYVLPVDYSITFDSNFAAFIKKLIEKGDIENLAIDMLSIATSIIKEEIAFDSMFYLIENFKYFNDNNSKPNNHFFDNLVAIEKFKSLDKRTFIKKGMIKPKITNKAAIDNAHKIINEFYYTDIGRDIFHDFETMHKRTQLFLIGMYTIEFRSKKGHRKKLIELLEYSQKTIGTIMERELIIAHKYFMKRKNVLAFDKINKGGVIKDLKNVLSNIAWDLTVPRVLEKLMHSYNEDGVYFPYFVTRDTKFRDMLNIYNTKGIFYDEKGMTPYSNINLGEYLYNEKIDKKELTRIGFDNDIERKEIFIRNKEGNFSIIDMELNKLDKLVNTQL